MHFSLPEARQLSSGGTSTYVGYDIHINGVFHCTVRFKQLHNLHMQLQQQYPTLKLPDFPPKKFLPLTNSQVEERRLLLERYLQLIGQNSTLSNSDLIIGFLASAQQEMYNETHHEVQLDVYSMLSLRIPLIVASTERTNHVLEKVCTCLHLHADLVKYFSLFLVDMDETTNEITIYKRLEDYESPYISQKLFKVKHKIYIRKSYWDISYDLILLKDQIALDVLYAQTVAEVKAGWIAITPVIAQQLKSLHENKQKIEYMELVRKQKHYGCVLSGRGLAKWSSGGTPKGQAKVLLCHSGLLLITSDKSEAFFKVVRMRCWRITTLQPEENIHDIQNGHLQNEGSHNDNGEPKLELSFEYLISKDLLQWVTILSDRSMFMSVCLQSIVDELMGLRNYCTLYKNNEKSTLSKKQNLTYLKRDGSSQIITPSSSTDTLSSGSGDSKSASSPKEKFSIKKLTEKFASVSFRSGHDFVENNAFGEIGDDDL